MSCTHLGSFWLLVLQKRFFSALFSLANPLGLKVHVVYIFDMFHGFLKLHSFFFLKHFSCFSSGFIIAVDVSSRERILFSIIFILIQRMFSLDIVFFWNFFSSFCFIFLYFLMRFSEFYTVWVFFFHHIEYIGRYSFFKVLVWWFQHLDYLKVKFFSGSFYMIYFDYVSLWMWYYIDTLHLVIFFPRMVFVLFQ